MRSFWLSIQKLRVLPSFPGDPEKERRAHLLMTVLDLSIGMMAAVFTSIFLADRPLLMNAVIIGVTILALWGLRVATIRGHTGWPSYLLIGGFCLVVTANLYATGTVRTPGVATYALIVFVAGFLLSHRAVLAVVVMNILALSGLMLLELFDLMPPADFSVTVTQWITSVAIISVSGMFSYWFRRDITQALDQARHELHERERTEVALRESEQRYRTLVEALPDLILVSDFERRILYANPALQRHEGMSLDEFQRANGGADLVHPDDRVFLRTQVEALRHSDREATDVFEYRILKAGQIEWRSGLACKIQYKGAPALLIVSRDITARKQAETEREQLIVELERRNAELERFTYTVSHDLKGPLVTIASFMGFLEHDAQTGNTERMIGDMHCIQEATAKMSRLLDDLLELSRVGRLMNPPEATPFADVVHDALERVHGRLQQRGIAVAVADELPMVYGDRERLVEVVQNLLDNAAKFMLERPDPQIVIGVQARADEQVLFVRDNGIGIDPAYHQKVFGLFDKLNRNSEGTGIGLALVKRIIEVHGGRIWVESQGLGCGAMFCFTLPSPPDAQS